MENSESDGSLFQFIDCSSVPEDKEEILSKEYPLDSKADFEVEENDQNKLEAEQVDAEVKVESPESRNGHPGLEMECSDSGLDGLSENQEIKTEEEDIMDVQEDCDEDSDDEEIVQDGSSARDCEEDEVFKLVTGPRRFCCLSEHDQLRIVKNGRPKPSLSKMKFVSRIKSPMCNRINHYEKYLWLTGSERLKKLFCWPCLLFGETLNRLGFINSDFLTSSLNKHQITSRHIKAFTTLLTFESEKLDSSTKLQGSIRDGQRLEEVKENREAFKRIMDVFSFDSQEGSSKNGDGTERIEVTDKLLELVAKYDPLLEKRLKSSSVFKQNLPTETDQKKTFSLKKDLSGSVLSVIKDKVLEDVKKTPFVTLIFQESGSTNKSRLASVVRFVDDSGVCQERLLSFIDLGSTKTSLGMFKEFQKIVDDLDCKSKIVAYSFDGAALPSKEMSELKNLIEKHCPNSLFVHYYTHNMSSIFADSASYIKECSRFFGKIKSLSSFFSQSPKRLKRLESFIKNSFPSDLEPPYWDFSYIDPLCTLRKHRSHLVDFFQSIEDEPNDWCDEEVLMAGGFIRFLNSFDTKLFLDLFYKVFSSCERISDNLLENPMDIDENIKQATKFVELLYTTKDKEFDAVWSSLDETNKDEEPLAKRKKTIELKENYRSIFLSVLDIWILQVELRFEHLTKVKFVSLLDSRLIAAISKTLPDIFKNLIDFNRALFDIKKLTIELKVFYPLLCLKGFKTVEEITYYLKQNKLSIVYTQVLKLAYLILTLICADISTERSSLERIETCMKTTKDQLNDSSSVERDVSPSSVLASSSATSSAISSESVSSLKIDPLKTLSIGGIHYICCPEGSSEEFSLVPAASLSKEKVGVSTSDVGKDCKESEDRLKSDYPCNKAISKSFSDSEFESFKDPNKVKLNIHCAKIVDIQEVIKGSKTPSDTKIQPKKSCYKSKSKPWVSKDTKDASKEPSSDPYQQDAIENPKTIQSHEEPSQNSDKVIQNPKPSENSRLGMFCIKCRRLYTSLVDFNFHLNSECSGDTTTFDRTFYAHSAIRTRIKTDDGSERTTLTCGKCGIRFSEERTLIQHFRSHNFVRPKVSTEKVFHSCEKCNKNFTSEEKVQQHLKKMHSVSAQCDVCNKHFEDRQSLLKHLRVSEDCLKNSVSNVKRTRVVLKKQS